MAVFQDTEVLLLPKYIVLPPQKALVWNWYCLTLIRLGFLRVVYPGSGGQFDSPLYLKINLSNIKVSLHNCQTIYLE